MFFIVHWINCGLILVTSTGGTWVAPKDQNYHYYYFTSYRFYSDFDWYTLMIYYSTLTSMGVDLYPTGDFETIFFSFVNFVGVLAYGIIIGNFSDML